MKDCISVVEDIEFGDGFIVVMFLELLQSPIGDIVDAVSFFVVVVKRETLGTTPTN